MKRWRPTHWFLLSLACFLGAFIVWKLNNSGQSGKPPATDSPAPGQPVPAASPAGALRPVQESVKAASTAPLLFTSDSATNATASNAPSPRDLLQKYRLRNTSRTVGELSRSDHAILLANALIDSSQALNLSIPDSLRATGDPGAYIVQAQGLIDDAFRARLKGAGASVVSYIPNNAYLVRASADVAKQLASLPGMQAVLPFEPYYKIPNFKLLAVAVEGQLLPPETTLNVLAFPGTEQTIEGALRPIGEIVSRDRSPFGPVFKVQARANSLTALARLPEVQTIEVATPRRLANDLSRVRVGVAVDTQTNINYLNLSGNNVIVYENDSGVDQQHPDLAGRVFSPDAASLEDTNGHGTHVAGIIGSSGSVSDTVNAIGSIQPGVTGQYRGKAPAARIFVLSLDSSSDLQLQEAAALTNALIDNNSWNYGSHDYDIAAANFDAGVRDSLTGTNGSQSVVYVFSAGNDGNGTSDGAGITEGSIQSPATSKNVISVGAIEQPRGITNEVMRVDGGVTNISTPWIRSTDSDNQVAGFSSRGNVGVDIEGDFGRFKPDVVAPGTFVVSTTTHDRWNTSRYYNNTSYLATTFIDTVEPGTIQPYPVFLTFNTVELFIGVFAIEPILDLPIYVDPNQFPTINDFPVATNSVFYSGPTPLEQFWFYAIGNPTNRLVRFQVTTVRSITNNVGNYFQVLSNMNNELGPHYRYESGTSMAAADVSGVLALIGDYFTNSMTAHLRPSPALMKAMLINGARSVNAGYDLQVRKTLNDQGWGLINLTNSLPPSVTNGFGALNHIGAMVFYDQDPTNALLTGDSRTLNVKVDPAANDQPLRFSLVWTDPPGNPAAGIKLVNDLDLIVTNLDDPREIYFGNDIPVGRNFNLPMDTNSTPKIDNINNVENIFIASPLTGTNYSVTVKAHRVNVNAVTAHTNGIAQDYALVISSGDGSVSNAISVATVPNITPFTALNITTITNEFGTNANVSGQTLTGQHVGANSPLLGLDRVPLGTNTMWGQPGTNGTITLGEANQWHFYVVTNGTSFTNATFRLGLPLNLALSRMGVTNYTMLKEAARVEADIDLYVSTESNLLTLDPTTVENARKSVGRGGVERVILNDAVPGQVYYVGVKAEDQQASEYRFTVLFTLLPPGQKDGNGFQVCYAVPEIIPDGTPSHPGGTRNLAIDWDTPGPIRRVVVQDIVEHERFGDLLGTLVRNGQTLVALNNHTCMTDPGGNCFTNFHYVYEDNGENDFNGLNGLPASQHTDGPGSLQDYIGMDGAATWELTMVDNQFGSSGRVVDFRILVETIQNSTNFILVKQPGSFAYAPVDVPPEATNMTICVSGVILPEQLFVRRAGLPTLTNFDYTIALTPPGGCLTIDKFDLPPLRTGRYFIGIYNPNPVTLTNIVSITFGLRLDAVPTIDYTSAGPAPIVDDAVTYSSIFVTNDQAIVRVEVGVALAHPRPSDLALTLISPSGKRILLSENREGLINSGLSAACGSPDTNSGWVQWDIPSGGNGHWYKAVATNNVTWSQADTIAHNECGYLATITSASENAFVFNLINNATFFTGVNGSGPAIGGLQPNGQVEPAGGWTWETGEPWVYNNWEPTQPDNGDVPANVENRAAFYSGIPSAAAATWNDLGQDDPNLGGYVIERDNPVLNYTVFTENTNFAQLPIKFQPFGNVSGATNQIVIGDFDGAAPGTYAAPTNVVGWDVLNNQVSVVNDPLNAHPGHAHYLALGGGLLSRTLNVVPGTRYIVNYSYRGPGIVGWWRGEPGVAAVDYVAGNNGSLESVDFMNGEVDQAFSFLSPDPLRKISIPDRPEFALTNALSIEGWVNIAGVGGRIIFWRGDLRGGFDPYFLQVNPINNNVFEFIIEDQTGTAAIMDAGAVPYGQWCHVAATWDGNTGDMRIYTNGFLSTVFNTAIRPFATLDTNSEPTLGIGNVGTHGFFSIPFFGGIDEMSLYARALSPTEVLAIYNTGTTGKFDRAVSAPLNLAKAQVALGGIGGDTFFGDNNIWRNRTLAFTPAVQAITLQVIGLEPGMLLDSLTLAELPINNYAKPEETLESVYGDNARGLWRLEIWDNRAGVPVTALINWQLKFIFEDNTPAITPLFNGIPVTNSVPACQIAYFSVDVPTWVNYVTNRLLFATGPVNVWFNQGIPPTTTNAADILLIGNSMGGSSTISTDLINYPPPLPPLLPGQRYYLAVENPCANGSNVTFAIEVDFGAGFIRLTNMVPYFNTSAGSNSVNDFYVYGVSGTAARAQFEINFPTGDMTLVARRGLPPPFLFGFDYMSSNPGSNDELIVVFTNSIPTPLGPGDWYLTAINVSGGPVSYSIMASEWPVTGRPFSITNAIATTNSFCFTWTALPLVHYYVQGLTALTNNNWITLSHTITAVTNEATFCVALPSDYHFFRVAEGLALEDVAQPPPFITGTIQTNGILLQWPGSVTTHYQVQWTPAISPAPVIWNNFTPVLTTTSGSYSFLDDGSQTGGIIGVTRFYRIRQLTVP